MDLKIRYRRLCDRLKSDLSPLGYEGPRGHYLHNNEENIHVLSFLKSSGGLEFGFTINIGFGFHKLYAMYSGTRDVKFKKPMRASHTHLIFRIGAIPYLLDERLELHPSTVRYQQDIWWRFNLKNPEKDEKLYEELRHVVIDVVQPFLSRCRDTEYFKNFFKKAIEGEKLGYNNSQAQWVVDALHSQRPVVSPAIKIVG